MERHLARRFDEIAALAKVANAAITTVRHCYRPAFEPRAMLFRPMCEICELAHIRGAALDVYSGAG
jgi:hypothetical protein